MSVARVSPGDQRLQAAARELQAVILAHYPNATFQVTSGDDPAGLYLIPTVDVDDTEEVADVVAERLLSFQVDEELPLFVFPTRPLGRVLDERRSAT